MRELFHPNLEQMSLPTILSALSDPVRLQIMQKLATKVEITCACCNIDLPKSALSHHFRVLREAGLIKVRIEGKQRFLSIRYADLETKFPELLNVILKLL